MLAAYALTALLALPAATQAVPSNPSLLGRVWSVAGAVLGEDEDSRYYLKLGGITTGAGFGLGPGVRFKGLAGGRLEVNAVAAVSYRKYLLAEASVVAPTLGVQGLQAGLFARRKYFPQEDFFGIGRESLRADRVNYSYDESAAGAFVALAPSPPLTIAGRLEYRHPDIGRGHDDSQPSIESGFTDASAPGLARQPDFIVATAMVRFVGARPSGHPRRGGRHEISISKFTDRGPAQYGFTRFDADLRQYVPLVPDRHILVFRAVTSLTGAARENQVPFYYLPALGGSTTLRGFRDFRFHDRNTLLFQGEYRWLVGRFVETALFCDAGTVSRRASGLRLDSLMSDYGAGVRIGTDARVFLRIESAFGSREGTRVFLKFSGAF